MTRVYSTTGPYVAQISCHRQYTSIPTSIFAAKARMYLETGNSALACGSKIEYYTLIDKERKESK